MPVHYPCGITSEVAAVPLRYLYLDMNAYFASVEQLDDPSLMGKPIVVAAADAATTSCIAASYEAKACGIRTGTALWEARRLCPGVIVKVGRHSRYVDVHQQILRAVGRCVPIHVVMSIDEMACGLLGDERASAKAWTIARQVKAAIRDDIGPALRCSVGLGPNILLAKVAGKMQKPDGLTEFADADIPAKLYALKLRDFPGIGAQMEKRLNRAGVGSVKQLYSLTMTQLCNIWQSKVLGERWFFQLRGDDIADPETHRRTVGHSHVLPPDLRSDSGSHGVLSRLIHKAGARLRSIDYWAGALTLGLSYVRGGRWSAGRKFVHCRDTSALLRVAGELWTGRPKDAGPPLQVWMVLTDLIPARGATPSLFAEDRNLTQLSEIMDHVNRAFGKHAVRFATMHGAEDTAPNRIAFTQIPQTRPDLD